MPLVTSLADLKLSAVFLVYVGLVAALIAAVLLRCLPRGRALAGIAVIGVWLGYAGIMGYSGVIGDPTRMPPGIFLLLTPIIAFIAIVLGRSPAGAQLAASLPLGLIFAMQSFRIGVELTLSSLHDAGLTTRLMTLAGGNVEILVGLSAPVIALIATRGQAGRRIALVWNVLGLLSLLNVATRAVLTAPGPLNLIHAELPNVAMGLFPFSYIPGFMAPLAMMLHVLAFRALQRANTTAQPATSQFA